MKTRTFAARHLPSAAFLVALVWGLTVTRVPAQTAWGDALSFDGLNDYVQAADVPLANSSFTVEAWVQRRSSDTMDMVVSQGNGEYNRCLMFGFHYYAGNQFVFDFYGNGVGSGTAETNSGWHHWAGTYDASSKIRCLYRDGLLVAWNTNTADHYQGSGPLRIGIGPGGEAPNEFDGQIDEVSVWNVARNQAEIQADMSQPLAGTEVGLIAYYRFDEATGTTAYDATTNHFDGALVNGPVWTASGAGIQRSLTKSNVFHPNALTYTFSNAPSSTEPGTLTVTTVADLDASSEFLTLGAEGVLTTNLFVTGGQQMVEVSTVVNLTQSQLAALAADGTITFTLTPSAEVNNLGASWARLELNYPSAGNAGFLNGSFETGDFTGWITTDLTVPFYPLAVRPVGASSWPEFFTSLPTDGVFSATHGFDGNGPGTIAIAQDVVVPANATMLTFDYQAAWDLVTFSVNPLPRVFRTVVQPPGGGAELAVFTNLIAPSETINTNTGPLTGTIDLAAFAGRNVRISFQAYVPEPSTGPAFFQLDHVRFLPHPNALDHFAWANIASPQLAGAPFPVSITALDQSNNVATNFFGTVALSGVVGGLTNHSILGSPVHNNTGNVGSFTLGYSFTPNTNLTVTHVRHYFGSKVSIWTDAGVLIASQNVTSVPGTWVETPLATPIQLTNGVTYRVATYSAGADYYWRFDMPLAFPDGTIDVSYEGSGDVFPTSGDDGARWWFVDLRYTVSVPINVAVSPTNSLNFVNGVWSGNLTVLQPVTNIVLVAEDTANRARHRGTSNPFDVLSCYYFFFDDFEPGIDLPLWSAFSGTVLATNYGGGTSCANSLWFGGDASRYAVTLPLNTVGGGTVDFWLRIADGASFPWENADLPGEGIVLEYSIDGGNTWVELGRYDAAVYHAWTHISVAIPIAAQTIVTQFRWRQLSHSGNDFDHWALDDVSVSAGARPPVIVAQPTDQAAGVGSDVTLRVTALGTMPLIYQWNKNGTNLINGGRITGATNQSLTIFNVVETDNGGYSVTVNNAYGCTNSSSATLLVSALDHFAWSAIASPQVAGAPFPVTITAWDDFNNVATWFSGALSLNAGIKFTATFDSGLDGFTFVPDPDASPNLWHRTSHRSTSPTNCLYYGNEGTWNYDTGARNAGNLQSPPISLAGAIAPVTLSFNYLLQTEGSTSFDQATVQISADGGSSWTLLAGPLANSASFINWTGDISSYAGSNILLRFNFDTIDSLYNAYEGWYVDDVVVADSTTATINPTNTGNFINGVWTGNLTVLQPATNIVLVAADNTGHRGTSNPFNVIPPAEALDHFTWSTIASPQAAGTPFPVTITARNQSGNVASYFSGIVALNGFSGMAQATNSILGSTNPSGSGFVTDEYTIGYSFTPNTNLTVTHVRHYFGSKVSIWTDSGTLLASQSVAGVPGAWTETPLASPLHLTNGFCYRVGVYFGNTNYYYRTDMEGVFPYGTIDVSYQGAGDAFPTFGDDGARWWFVDLRYAVGSPVAVAPANTGTFVNGIWSGNLTVSQPATNMVLVARDNADHSGTSNPFILLPPPPSFASCCVSAPGQFWLQASGAAGWTYTLQTSTNLVDWEDHTNIVAGPDGLIECVEQMESYEPTCFYRLRLLP